jgi:hypothetical protein
MYKISLFLLFCLSGFHLHAQSCKGSAIFSQGKHFVFQTELATSDSTVKKKLNTYIVQYVKNEGGLLTATYKLEKTDTGLKNASSTLSILNATCDGKGVIYHVSVTSARMNADYLIDFPDNMKAGDILKGHNLNIDMHGKGSVSVAVSRKVVGEEILTIPPGKMNCFKIAETSSTTISGMNGQQPRTMNDPVPFYTWYAPGTGIIKMAKENVYTTTLIAID